MMANWQERAKTGLENRKNKTNNTVSTPSTSAVTSEPKVVSAPTSTNTWQEKAQYGLHKRGYVPPTTVGANSSDSWREVELKKDDGTSLGFVSQKGLKAISENKTSQYTPLNDEEKKTIDAYIEYASKKRQEIIDTYKTAAQATLANLEKEKSEIANEATQLRRSRAVASRTGKQGTEWEIKDTRTGKEKREGKPIAQSVGAGKLKALDNKYASLDEEADALVEDISNIEKYANVVYNETGFWGQAKANYGQGRLSQDTASAYNDYVVSRNETDKIRADAYAALSEQFINNNKNAFTTDDEDIGKLEQTARDWIAGSFASYLPQLIDQTKASIKGTAIGGTTGAAAGSIVPGVGTAAGLSYGLKTGWVLGASKQMFDTTRGMVFQTLIEAGYDEETAIAAANDEAFLSSIVEGAGEIVSMATLGTGKLIGKIAPNATKKIASNVVVKGVKGFAEKTGKIISKNLFLKTTKAVAGVFVNAVSEYAEEYTQEAISIANEKRLKDNNSNSLLSETFSVLRNPTAEMSERLHNAGTQGFRVGLMMGGATKIGTSALQKVFSIGDTYQDTKTGNIVTVTGVDGDNTSFEVNNGTKTTTGTFSNSQFQSAVEGGQLVKVDSPTSTANESTTTVDNATPVVENTETISESDNAVRAVENVLKGEKLSSSAVNKIISTPTLKTAFEQLTGQKIQGTKSEQRAIVRDAQNNFDVTEVNNTSVAKETTPIVQDVTETSNIPVVAKAAQETFMPEAIENIKSIPNVNGDITKFVTKVADYYNRNGSLHAFADYFTDGGKKFISAIENTMATDKLATTSTKEGVGEESKIADRKEINLKRVGKNYEVYGEDAKLLAEAFELETEETAIDGKKTDVFRLPADLAEGLADAMSDEYNLIMNDKVATKLTTEQLDDILEEKQDENVKNVENATDKGGKRSIEREDNDNEHKRTNLYGRNGRRGNIGSTQKQAERISYFERKNKGKDATERQRYGEELLENGKVEVISNGDYEYALVKSEDYNDDMLSMVEEAKNKGVRLGFFIGEAVVSGKDGDFFVNGIKFNNTSVLVRYDAEKSPQLLAKHEISHAKWNTPAIQKIKNTILKSLTNEDKRRILSSERMQHYQEIYKNDDGQPLMDVVWEEYVCDVMSGMIDDTANYIDVVTDYWYGNEAVDSYKVSEYTESIDAGGVENVWRNNLGRTDRFSIADRNQRRRSESGERDVSVRETKVVGEEIDSRLDFKRTLSEKRHEGNMEWTSSRPESSDSEGRERTNGARFLEAVKTGQYDIARQLLDEQAEKNGYEPANVYHGTKSEKVFTKFENEGAIWVSTNLEYAKQYAEGNTAKSELFTDNNAVFDLYAKKDKILDVGDIDKTISSPNEILAFGESIGFTKEEILRCWSAGRKYEYNKVWTMTITPEFAKIARKYGYDTLKAVEKKGSVITYGILYPENVKSAKLETYDDNGHIIPLSERFNPQKDDIRFSLSEPVEETRDLIAVHNMQVSELERTLDLGGLPMPSIAIIKAQSGHSEYGDVSLVFDKQTIDPKASKSNKVYGGDAWTPVYPKIEYKPNKKIADKISKKYYELGRKFGYDESRPLYNYVYELEEQLNRHKGEKELLNELYDDTNMMQLYLLDSGKNKVETIKKEVSTELTDAEVEMNEFFINELGADVVDAVMWDGNGTPISYRKDYLSKHEDAIREAYKKLLSEVYQFSDEQVQNVLDIIKPVDLLRFMREAHKYRQNGRVTTKTEDDYTATKEAIKEAAGEGYRDWVDSLFKGLEEKSGIRNNADYFTNSGNRRSWEALHWENNLENVVKVMKSQDNGVAAFFSGQGIWAVSAKDYRSVDEIKADSDRLKRLSEEEYNEIKEGFGTRFNEIAESIMSKTESNPFIALDNAMDCIVEAVRNSKTKSGLLKNLKEYPQLTVTETTVDDIVSLVADISNMPTEYFEAKPKRAVELNEIATAIIPDTTNESIKAKLNDMGIKFVEYESGNEQSRLDALNSLEEVRFSVADNNELETQKKIESIAKEIGSHDELITVAKANTKEFVGKIKENKSLQKRLHNAKRQMLVSPNPIVNAVKVGKVTKDILNEMNSTLKASELKAEVMDIYTEYFAEMKKSGGVESKTAIANENMMLRFASVAVDIADSAEVLMETEEYSMLKSYIQNVRIKVPDSAKSDVHYAEFRKANMGTFNLTNDGLSVDIVYAELCELFPGMFDTTITNSADQLLEIADRLESLKPYAYNPHEGLMSETVEHIVYRFVSETDGLAAMPKTKAQKMAEKSLYDKEMALEKERASFNRKLEQQKEKSETKIQKLQKKIDDFKYTKYWENRLDKEEKNRTIAELKEEKALAIQRGKEEKARAVKEVRERRDVAILKTKIRNIVSDLKKNIDKTEKAGGYPKELVKAAADVCSALDFHTDHPGKDGEPNKSNLRLDALKMEYDALKKNGNYDFESEYSEELSDKIEKLHQLVKDKRVIDLKASELSELKDILSEIRHRLSTARKQIGKAKAQENAELALDIINTLESKKDVIDANKMLLLKQMKLATQSGKAFVFNPHRINEMIAGYDKNSVWWQLYDEINRGSRKASKFVADANKPFDELVDGGGNEIAFYDFRTKKIKTGIKYADGSEVEIPKSIICELMMMWERKSGRTHLESGGASIPDIALYNKGMTVDALKGGKQTKPITQADIARLRGMLDSYDLAWIEKSHYLFDNVAKDAINTTSMELLGREIAKGKNYIRIFVDNDFVGREVGKDQENITLEGHGSLKETVPEAKQPIVLRGLQENVYDHIDFVSKYYGLAIPIRNFNKVYRMKFSDDGGQRSVQKVIGQKFGAKIQINVVEQFVKDLQAARPKSIEPFGKIRGNWLTATFWGNISSMLKQTTSYWTASALLGEDSLVKGLASYVTHRKQTKAEINKYSGTLYKRSQGLSTTELGDRANRKRLAGASSKVTKAINKYAPVLRNVPEWIRPGNWLQSMDCAVSSALWDACKVEVSKTMKPSDEGYMKSVTDLYESVIEETQSNYDVAHRPEALKNTNAIVRTITMFQTDNLQQTGIIYNAFGDLSTKAKNYKVDKSSDNKKALYEAETRLKKAILSRLYSSVWLVFMTVAGQMLLRKFLSYIDDEEKEITSNSVLKQAMLNMAEDMFGVFVPVGGELISKAMDTFTDGYDFVTDPSFETIQDFIEATSKIWDEATDEEGKGDVWGAVVDAIPAISNFTGIPAKNISDLFKAVKGYAGDIKAGEFAHDLTDYTTGNKSFYSYGDLAASIINGNKEKEKKILDYYSANGKEIAKSSLTEKIKPVYVQLYIDAPEKAKAIKRQLILEYDYSEDSIGGWAMQEYLKNVVEEPGYAKEIKATIQKEVSWTHKSVQSDIKSYYKKVYKDGDEKETKELRNALLTDGGISDGTLSKWEHEADKEVEKKEKESEKEKAKYE